MALRAGKAPSCPVATNPRTATSKNVRPNISRKDTRSGVFRKKRRSGAPGRRKIRCPVADARVGPAAAKPKIARRLERVERRAGAAPDRAHLPLGQLPHERVREREPSQDLRKSRNRDLSVALP